MRRDRLGYPALLKSREGNRTMYYQWRQLWLVLTVIHVPGRSS